MFFPWYTILMLALESNQVIGLRLMKIAGGGRAARDEARLMISEKVNASFEAGAALMEGYGMLAVVDRFREHVAENGLRGAKRRTCRPPAVFRGRWDRCGRGAGGDATTLEVGR